MDARTERILAKKVGSGQNKRMKFGLNGQFKDDCYADAVVGFIVDTTLDSDTPKYQTARWFLFESEQAFFVICERAGIDAEKLRRHLRNHIAA